MGDSPQLTPRVETMEYRLNQLESALSTTRKELRDDIKGLDGKIDMLLKTVGVAERVEDHEQRLRLMEKASDRLAGGLAGWRMPLAIVFTGLVSAIATAAAQNWMP